MAAAEAQRALGSRVKAIIPASIDLLNLDEQFVHHWAGDNWLPVSGDWNGDGQDGLGLFDPQTRIFYLKNEISLGDADFIVGYEEAPVGWMPLAGDWDGDGRDTLGLYQPDTETFYLKNTIQPGMPDKIMQYGPRQDAWAPIVGLWK